MAERIYELTKVLPPHAPQGGLRRAKAADAALLERWVSAFVLEASPVPQDAVEQLRPPALRGCGYASAAVATLSERLLASGRSRIFLFTDRSNPTSNSIYQRIGYRPVCDADQYRFWR